MHLATTLAVVVAVLWWGDWKHWSKYDSTMLFIAAGNLTYKYVTGDYTLWAFKSHLLSGVITELIYTFIILPGTVLLFLSNFPKGNLQKLLRIIKWVAIYVGFEGLYLAMGAIVYDHGWGFLWSIAFDIMMFPLVLLHSIKPHWAYLMALFFGSLITYYFKVPVKFF